MRMSRRPRPPTPPQQSADGPESDLYSRFESRRRGGGTVTRADVAAAILWVGATLYAVFGGADFGAGFWDLIAGNAEKGERPRALIQRSLTPVWEANHVW